ncbi:MAG: response regulator of the LytR/AlgR family [Bacteroidetes bacterium]|nr:MAG: response regulator of the LytR/AlgR family [Bacteroidota bacterium]
MKVFIAEDDVFISEQLREVLIELGYTVTGIGFNFESSVRLLEQSPPDMAILDIKMHGSDQGFEIARYINENVRIPYIFLTSFSDKNTVLSAVGFKPAAYLVKPFSSQDIFSTLEVVKNNFIRKQNKVTIRDGHKTIVLDVTDVLWIKSDDKYVEIQTSTKKYVQRGTIRDALKQLAGTMFERVHRSYAINIEKVSMIRSNCIVVGETEIPVSRVHIERIRKLLG